MSVKIKTRVNVVAASAVYLFMAMGEACAAKQARSWMGSRYVPRPEHAPDHDKFPAALLIQPTIGRITVQPTVNKPKTNILPLFLVEFLDLMIARLQVRVLNGAVQIYRIPICMLELVEIQ